ncbi:MAG TPA: GNAT family protein [Acidimicrobiales bacterium]|nr:GNAT family protein [Acidimicrobiales bacterium]
MTKRSSGAITGDSCRAPHAAQRVQGRARAGRTLDEAPLEFAEVHFREATPADARSLLRLKLALDSETNFMLLETGERAESAEEVAAHLAAVGRTANSVVIVADTRSMLVGYAEATGGRFRRDRGTAYVVLGVLARAQGRGIGAGLLSEVARWASPHDVHRLELTVMAHNERAVQLYQRAGFTVEGRRRQCLLVDGCMVDELYMARLLTPGGTVGR